MEEIQNTQHIKRRTVVSTLSLFVQSGYSAFLGLVANLVLTILLSPKIFGIYITVLSIISLLNYFSDIGLAASLVQKKEVSEDDIKTAFTTQQLLIISVLVIGFLLTSFIKNFYQLPKEGVYLYWALLFSFFLSSLKTIPSIFLERKIQFQKIVLVQIIENTVFYVSVIIFALAKFELTSFTIAVILRSIIGLVTIYSISFWKPKIGISRESLKHLLSFGLPFQASSFLALFKDDLIILYLGKVLGFEGVGYIGWAKKWAEAPIRIVMDNISRVLFPVISRLQHEKEKISRLIERILYYQTALLAPTILGLALTMNRFIAIIPKYGKWAPALPLFYLFCITAFCATFSSPFINLFNALGKAKLTFAFMFSWTVATWLLTPTFTKMFGLYGFPLAQVILSLSVALVVIQAKRLIKFNFFKPIYRPLIASIIMASSILPPLVFFRASIFTVSSAVVIGSLVYFIIMLFIFKTNLILEVKSLFLNE